MILNQLLQASVRALPQAMDETNNFVRTQCSFLHTSSFQSFFDRTSSNIKAVRILLLWVDPNKIAIIFVRSLMEDFYYHIDVFEWLRKIQTFSCIRNRLRVQILPANLQFNFWFCYWEHVDFFQVPQAPKQNFNSVLLQRRFYVCRNTNNFFP